MSKIFLEENANLSALQGQKIAVIGYGKLGRPFALNLHDHGLHVLIGNQDDEFAERARQDGFHVHNIVDAATEATILLLTMPDEAMPQIYLEQVAPHLKTNDLLIFASGYNIAYQFIEPPMFVDVGLLAPRTLAAKVRQGYVDGSGFLSSISMHHKASPNGAERLLAVALAVGALKRGAMEVTFQQEVELDLFWQQVIMPALHNLLLTAAQVLDRAGFPQEIALMELYLSGEMGEFFARAAEQGLVETLQNMSLTGQYGLLSRTERFQESKLTLQMENILDAIQTGDFAREWSTEYTDGYPRLQALRQKYAQMTLWKAEKAILQRDADGTSSSS